MRILLVNNHTVHLDSLVSELAGHQIEILEYRPGAEFNDKDKDLIILSGGGGEGFELEDFHKPGQLWYEDEIEFVQKCNKPIFGICMGFEIICYAYGSQLISQSRLLEGFMEITLAKQPAGASKHTTLRQYESHNWHIEEVQSRDLEVLAFSDGGIEAVKHRRKKIMATQFHPEKSGGSWRLSALACQAVAI